MSAEYSDERDCLCVCLSVHDHIPGTTRPIFSKYFCACVPWPWLGPALAGYVRLRISGFVVDDVIFAHKLIGFSTSPPG